MASEVNSASVAQIALRVVACHHAPLSSFHSHYEPRFLTEWP